MADRIGVILALAALVYAAYWVLVPPRLRMTALFAVSFALLAAQDLVHMPFVLVLSLLAWLSVKKKRGRAVVLALTVASLVLYRALGPSMTIFAIVGFSYTSFKLVSYLVESLRDNLETEPGLDRVLAYIFFFPTFYAGPIARIGAFDVKPAHEANDFIQGVKRILWGCVKKVAIVSWLDAHGAGSPASALLAGERSALAVALLLLPIRIYADFSAYSDLAVGAGRLFGVTVPENFHYPYCYSNIVQFWQNWHITLSEWLRDYIFMPLSRVLMTTPLKKMPTAVAALAYLVSFTLCGAWHGFSPHFVAWGSYHGLLLGGHRFWNDRFAKRREHPIHRWRKTPAFQLAACAVTFAFVSVGWLFFQYSLGDVGRLAGRLVEM